MSFITMTEFNQIKPWLSLDFEIDNRNQTQIKHLKGSKTAYLGLIAEAIFYFLIPKIQIELYV